MLRERIESRGWVLADGAMGTMLFERGLPPGQAPEVWNLERPQDVGEVHRQYIEAGARIVLTNSFGGNRFRLEMHDMDDQAEALNNAAAQIARAQADAVQEAVLVGGSMGPTGKILKPLGDLALEDAVASFEQQARALLEGGVDLIWVETMSALEEVQAAVQGARQADSSVPIVATMTFDTHGHTAMGVSPEAALDSLTGLGLAAIGANCGNGPQEIETVISQMRAKNPQSILVAKSNAGKPRVQGDRTVYDATPEVMGVHASRVVDLGANIVGACCGSTPEHIRAIRQALEEMG